MMIYAGDLDLICNYLGNKRWGGFTDVCAHACVCGGVCVGVRVTVCVCAHARTFVCGRAFWLGAKQGRLARRLGLEGPSTQWPSEGGPFAEGGEIDFDDDDNESDGDEQQVLGEEGMQRGQPLPRADGGVHVDLTTLGALLLPPGFGQQQQRSGEGVQGDGDAEEGPKVVKVIEAEVVLDAGVGAGGAPVPLITVHHDGGSFTVDLSTLGRPPGEGGDSEGPDRTASDQIAAEGGGPFAPDPYNCDMRLGDGPDDWTVCIQVNPEGGTPTPSASGQGFGGAAAAGGAGSQAASHRLHLERCWNGAWGTGSVVCVGVGACVCGIGGKGGGSSLLNLSVRKITTCAAAAPVAYSAPSASVAFPSTPTPPPSCILHALHASFMLASPLLPAQRTWSACTACSS